MSMQCVVCGSVFDPRTAGRPRTYCTERCRDVAEFRRRKLRRRRERASSSFLIAHIDRNLDRLEVSNARSA